MDLEAPGGESGQVIEKLARVFDDKGLEVQAKIWHSSPSVSATPSPRLRVAFATDEKARALPKRPRL